MKVKDLIDKLQKLNQEAIVTDNGWNTIEEIYTHDINDKFVGLLFGPLTADEIPKE